MVADGALSPVDTGDYSRRFRRVCVDTLTDIDERIYDVTIALQYRAVTKVFCQSINQ